MGVDVSKQSQESSILLARRRNFRGGLESLIVGALAEVSVGQIELHVIGIGIGLQCRLKMLDGVVI